MNELYTHLAAVFFSFFAIMNPVANTAAFTALTADKNPAERGNIAAKSLLLSFCVICAFSLLGKTIFHLFGISLPALRIAGGIIVFIVGYHMLNGSGSKLHTSDATEEGDIAVSPLAIPLLAGPGTIATAVNYSASGGLAGVGSTISVFGILCLVTYLCFIYSAKVMKLIGESGLSIVTRLMGLILAVMGTQLVIDGVGSLPNFANL